MSLEDCRKQNKEESSINLGKQTADNVFGSHIYLIEGDVYPEIIQYTQFIRQRENKKPCSTFTYRFVKHVDMLHLTYCDVFYLIFYRMKNTSNLYKNDYPLLLPIPETLMFFNE